MRDALNILIVEDVPDDARLVVEELRSAGFDPQWRRVDEETGYREGLDRDLHLVISDFNLPRFSAERALELFLLSGLEIPFIIVSGTIGEERAVEVMKAGATDYVLKNNLRRLGPCVRRALRESNERRERRNLEAQFRQSQKMESIGQLAGGIAHDFNNMLTVIQGHASMLLADPDLSDDARESASEISTAAESAANLTRQLLTFSRRQVLQQRPLNLNEAIDGTTKMLRRVLGADVALQFQPGSVSQILADAGMIEQILMNVAINARDAMPAGGMLTICTGTETIREAVAERNPEVSPGDFVWLEVADTGCGIPPEILPKIFEPFFTTKEAGRGTGLGLATVYGIVKQHRGWITIRSKVNEGTAFKIYLPVCAGLEGESTSLSSSEPIRGGHETILVVEDEASVRQLVCSVLESHGYRAVIADSGTAALQQWEHLRGEIDLLLTDLVMPGGLNGRKLAEELRAKKPRLRIVFTSGYSGDIVGQDYRLREGINFLQKPYAPRALAHCIRACLDSSRL